MRAYLLLTVFISAIALWGQKPAPTAALGHGWAGDPSPIVWESAHTKTPPVIDGVLDDDLHEEHSVSTVIVLRFKGGPGKAR